ncbi:MAG: hypothetical protein QQN63_07550 [Nitrosopumilus sp.]
MANSTSTFRALYTLGGNSVVPTFSYGIAASEDWSVGSVVAWNASSVLIDPTDDSSDVLGISLDTVVSGVATGPVTDRCAVHPFMHGIVYAVKNVSVANDTPVVTDIGTFTDLDLDSTVWGIITGTSSTSNTPNFKIVDIDTIRDEWHVVIAVDDQTPELVFQWIAGEGV